MLELYTPNYEVKSTKERITIDLIKDGQEFLEQFDINNEFLIDTVSLVYKYQRILNNTTGFRRRRENRATNGIILP